MINDSVFELNDGKKGKKVFSSIVHPLFCSLPSFNKHMYSIVYAFKFYSVFFLLFFFSFSLFVELSETESKQHQRKHRRCCLQKLHSPIHLSFRSLDKGWYRWMEVWLFGWLDRWMGFRIHTLHILFCVPYEHYKCTYDKLWMFGQEKRTGEQKECAVTKSRK